MTFREPSDYSDTELIALLKDRYTAMPVPPCRICGGPLSVARTGGGEATQWACSEMEDDPANPGRLKRKEGRGVADDHFARSYWTQYRSGDEFVLEAIARLARAKADSAQPSADNGAGPQPQRFEGSFMVFHQAPTGNIVSGDMVVIKKKR